MNPRDTLGAIKPRHRAVARDAQNCVNRCAPVPPGTPTWRLSADDEHPRAESRNGRPRKAKAKTRANMESDPIGSERSRLLPIAPRFNANRADPIHALEYAAA